MSRWAEAGQLEGEKKILTHEEVLQILSEMARKGSVTAASVLERALRLNDPEPELDGALERLLQRD